MDGRTQVPPPSFVASQGAHRQEGVIGNGDEARTRESAMECDPPHWHLKPYTKNIPLDAFSTSFVADM